MTSAQPCPQCDAVALSRSHSRTFAERVRKVLSSKRLHRCSECGWRGWLFVLIPLEEPEEVQVAQESPDLAALDHGLQQRSVRVAL